MTNTDVFIRQIELISGVESFLLIESSGEVASHNINNADDLAAMAILGGISSNAIMESIGFSRCRHLTFNRIDRRNFFIFFLDQYLLGIQQIAGADDQRLVAEIHQRIDNLPEQSNSEVEH